MAFKNCKIAGVGVNPTDYHSRRVGEDGKPIERGNPNFVISPSVLKTIAECPARWLAGYTPPDSDAKDWGNLLDTILLTPTQFQSRYAIQPDTYEKTVMECPSCKSQTESQKCAKCKCERVPVKITNDWNNNSATCGEWTEAQKKSGKEIVTKTDIEAVGLAIKKIHGDSILREFIAASETQVWVVGEWHDEATGLVVPVQCLIDFAPVEGTKYELCLGDLKSTRSAKPFVWEGYSRQRGYHVQAAFDVDLYNAAVKREFPREQWCFVLSENFPPYQTGRVILESVERPDRPSKLEYGRMLYKAYLAKYCQCLKTGHWGDYQDEPGAVEGWSVDRANKLDELEYLRVIDQVAQEDEEEAPPVEEDDLIP